jgi:acyl carrier protein
VGGAISARMDSSKHLTPNPTDLIDWMNAEGLLELDWDFPEDGDLFEAGLDSTGVVHLTAAVEDEYGVEVTPEEFAEEKVRTPLDLANLINAKL